MRRIGNVLVVGGGVSGMTTALCLLRNGLSVTLVAEHFAPRVTSVVAGALWEWPPAVCGYHHDQISLSRSKEWCMTSYEIFDALARDPDTGVFMRDVIFYFRYAVDDHQAAAHKMNELKDKVRGFVHDRALIDHNQVNPDIGLRDAYGHLAPMVDTDVYMGWIRDQVVRAGGRVVQGRITGNLAENEAELKAMYRADMIVNCAGLGSPELSGEAMYPLRGALVRVRNDGRAMPRITKAHCISHDETRDEQDIVFIVPRGRDMLVLGGLAEPDQWDTGVGLDSYQPVRDMLERCREFMPVLRRAEIDPEEPVRVGLRPFRRGNVRLDREPSTSIIHNYGHGGAGVTFSWGCALEVAAMVAAELGADRPMAAHQVV